MKGTQFLSFLKNIYLFVHICKFALNIHKKLETLIEYMKKRPTKKETQSSAQPINKVLKIKCQQFLLCFY